jgi:hypothetical protein
LRGIPACGRQEMLKQSRNLPLIPNVRGLAADRHNPLPCLRRSATAAQDFGRRDFAQAGTLPFAKNTYL